MKKLFSFFAAIAACASLMASTTFTFTGASDMNQTKDGITVTLAKGNGSTAPASYDNGLRMYANNTITVAGSQITSVKLSFTKQGKKDYATLSASDGNLSSGGTSTSATDEKTDTWTGSASQVVFTLGATGQRVITKIVVVGAGGSGGDDTGGEGGGEGGGDTPGSTDLNPDYVYEEPTTVLPNGDSINGSTYQFVENNILVNCTKGAENSQYFSVHASNSITFSASKPIKAIAVCGYIKQGFSATASAGTIDYLDATESEMEADPVLIVTDINNTSVTLNCVKQLRCYYVDFYFEDGYELELGEDGGDDEETDYTYEPLEATALSFTLDTAIFFDYTADYGLIDVWMESEEYAIEMYFYANALDPVTGIPAGTYPINSTEQAGTVAASPGGTEELDYPSYVATDFTELGYGAAYYLMSGTVTVEAVGTPVNAVKITVSATTYNGSTVNAEYTGRLVEYVLDGVENINGDDNSLEGTHKHLENGQVVIYHNNNRYTLLGTRL